MSFSVGSILALVTLIGSILIGGANFGDLRTTAATNTIGLTENRVELREMKEQHEKDYRYTQTLLSSISNELSVMNEMLRRLEDK